MKKQTIITVISISILAVLSHWNIWSIGIYALGWNTTLFWLSVCYLAWENNSSLNFKRNWQWVMPVILITLSFSLFENPWLKIISCFLLPLASTFFYGYSQITNQEKYDWNIDFLDCILKRMTLPLKFIGNAAITLSSVAKGLHNGSDFQFSKRIGKGLLILLPIALVVLILLGSADQNFSNIIEALTHKIFLNFSFIFIAKILCIIVLSIGLIACIHAWQKTANYDGVKNADLEPSNNIDSVVAGIVMGGVTAIYGLFLWLQLEHLIVGSLPLDFSQAEQIVKSGFWQLFFLSILNVALFFIIYKNTTNTAQIILRIFIIASGFLLLSAAWRMSLYVYYYGLSYEKLFASYTIVFALVILIFLIISSFKKNRKNIFRFIAFCSLWFYGVATILPVEKIILKTNIKLVKSNNTRINLVYLQALSADVLKDIQKLTKDTSINHDSILNISPWSIGWLDKKMQIDCKREWYEKNLSLVMNCR